MTNEPKPRGACRGSRFPRFGLLTLLIVGVVASLAFALAGNEIQLARRESAALEALQQAGAKVVLQGDADWSHTPEPSNAPLQSESTATTFARAFGRARRPALHTVWLDAQNVDGPVARRAFAALPHLTEIERLVLTGPFVDDAALEAVAKLSNLETLELSESGVTAPGLEALAHASQLRELRIDVEPDGASLAAAVGAFRELREATLSRIDVSRSDMERLASLPHLEQLTLYEVGRGSGGEVYAPLRDAGSLRKLISWESLRGDDLRHVARMRNLEELQIDGISDDALVHLQGHQGLRKLYLGLPATDEAARSFSEANPGCTVLYETWRGGNTYLDGRPSR